MTAISSAGVTRAAAREAGVPRVTVGTAWPAGWGDCAAAAESRSLFLGPTWFELYTRYFADASTRYLVSFDQAAAQPACVLPVTVRDGTAEAFTNYYASRYGPIGPADSDATPRHVSALVAALVESRPRLHGVRLQPILRDSDEYAALADAFSARGWVTEEFFCFGNWIHRTRGADFASYFASLPGALRSTITRKRKKLLKRGATIDVYHAPADIERHFAAFEEVYRRSWKVREDRADFVRDLALAFGGEGCTRLGVVRLDDRVIASQFWIVRAGTASIYKLAYDEAFAELSAGTVLSDALFRHAIDEDRVELIDYLTGDDGYKKDWMSERREFWGLYAHNPWHWRGALGAGRTLCKRVVRGRTAAAGTE